MKKSISIVVPVFNEQLSINAFRDEIIAVTSNITEYDFEFIFVDDGSRDGTVGTIKNCFKHEKSVVVLELSRNFGKEAALLAGLRQSKGNAVIPIDVDLQDPPNLIQKLIEKWENGAEVVLAQRIRRSGDSFSKRICAWVFYKLFNVLSSISLPENVGDFRLMDRMVVNAIIDLPENQLFLKGIFAWVGFKQDIIKFERPERKNGKESQTNLKLFSLALDGITSFGFGLLRIWVLLGFLAASFSLIYGLSIVARVFLYGIEVPGYASIMVVLTFFSGLQFFALGILGEYLGRVYIESKRRPPFIVKNDKKPTTRKNRIAE